MCVALGIVAAGIAARLQPDGSDTPREARLPLALAACGGAVLGAYLLELPADLLGWTAAPPAGAAGDALPLGGRTVLGGILGGWLAVESAKPRLGIRTPTGDAFALPLAVALCCGRFGCLFAGCCVGVECAPSPFALVDAAGTPRVPVPVIEIAFHAAAALAIAIATRLGRARGRRLAVYVATYAALRFVLEEWRPHPELLLGMSWYQFLAIALAALGATTAWRRTRRARQDQ